MESKNRKKTFTVMIIPHSEKTTLTFNIPLIAAQVISMIAVTGIIAGIVFVFSYQEIKRKMETYYSGFVEYKTLRDQIDFFAKKTDDLQQKLKTIEKLDTDIRTILKNDPAIDKINKQNSRSADAAVASRGGQFTSIRYSDTVGGNMLISMETVEQQMTKQQESLQEIKEAVIERQTRLDATPSIWPLKGARVTSAFGFRRSPYGRRIEFHNGIDMTSHYGAPIYAACSGKVTFAGWKAGYGRTVIISNGCGFTTLYGHASKLAVKTGQTVKKGQIIANVGNSGRSTGAHLHFEVALNGQLKDPKGYLP